MRGHGIERATGIRVNILIIIIYSILLYLFYMQFIPIAVRGGNCKRLNVFCRLREIVVKVHSKQMIKQKSAQTTQRQLGVFLNIIEYSCNNGCCRVRQKDFSSEELCGWRGWWYLSLIRWTPAGHYQGKTSPKRRKINNKIYETTTVQ